MSLPDRWQIELDHLRAEGRYRTLKPPAGMDFSSNDYLGYAGRAGSVSDRSLSRSGAASRLLRGHHAIWDEVESKLAAWHGTEAALVMTSGYSANEGLLSTICEPGDLVFSDQLNHASIIDGLRLARAEKIIFRHNDVNELESLFNQRRQHRTAKQAWFIVTESLFGMEGDRAPLTELADLAGRFNAALIVDEAHATGCFGTTGGGLVDALGVRDHVLASVHTGGKALAVPGAYIACSALLRDLLVNRCRHLIFTTALPPVVGGWWLDTLVRVSADEAGRQQLHERARAFRRKLVNRNVVAGGSDYIVSIVIGVDEAAVRVAEQLQEAGFDIRAIRPPTVPSGTARLRVSIHADHEVGQLQVLSEALATALQLSP